MTFSGQFNQITKSETGCPRSKSARKLDDYLRRWMFLWHKHTRFWCAWRELRRLISFENKTSNNLTSLEFKMFIKKVAIARHRKRNGQWNISLSWSYLSQFRIVVELKNQWVVRKLFCWALVTSSSHPRDYLNSDLRLPTSNKMTSANKFWYDKEVTNCQDLSLFLITVSECNGDIR